jgi:hypothetical protein
MDRQQKTATELSAADFKHQKLLCETGQRRPGPCGLKCGQNIPV